LKRFGKSTFFLPHGVDLSRFISNETFAKLSTLKDLFSSYPAGKRGNFSKDKKLSLLAKASQNNCTEHSLVSRFSHPRIGYVGLVDDRLDWILIEKMAQALKAVSFIFVGKLDKDLHQLPKLENIHFVGPVSYEEVPDVLHSFDVLILPYVVNSFTQTINPLKLKEYLASGVPVVGVPLPEIKKFAPFVHLARTPEEWVAAIKRITRREKRANYSPELLDLLAKEDWAFKAQEFLKMVTT